MIPEKYLFIPYVVLSVVLVSLLFLSFVCYLKKKRLARNQDSALVRYNNILHIVKKSRINLHRAVVGEIVEFYKDPAELNEVYRTHPELNPHMTKVSVIGRWKRLLSQKGEQKSQNAALSDVGDKAASGKGNQSSDASGKWFKFVSLLKGPFDGGGKGQPENGDIVTHGGKGTTEHKKCIDVVRETATRTTSEDMDYTVEDTNTDKVFVQRSPRSIKSVTSRTASEAQIDVEKDKGNDEHVSEENEAVIERSCGVHTIAVARIRIVQAGTLPGRVERVEDNDLEVITC